jgi:NTP pyrophosphatase (non-canonical NTP hydrolase)
MSDHMNPEEYQREALSTESTPNFIDAEHEVLFVTRASEPSEPQRAPLTSIPRGTTARLLHALIGICTEAGESQDALKKALIYKRPVGRADMIEEFGDLLWYIALGLSAVQSTISQAMRGNLAKLKKRFPDKFRLSAATERDTEAEMDALEATLGVGRPNDDYSTRELRLIGERDAALARAEAAEATHVGSMGEAMLQRIVFNYWRAAFLMYTEASELNQADHRLFDDLWRRFGVGLPIGWTPASAAQAMRDKAKETAERHLAEPARAPSTGAKNEHAFPEEYANQPINAKITDTHPAIRNTDEPQTTFTKADMDKLREQLYTEMEQRRAAVNKVVELENRINALVTTFDALRKP